MVTPEAADEVRAAAPRYTRTSGMYGRAAQSVTRLGLGEALPQAEPEPGALLRDGDEGDGTAAVEVRSCQRSSSAAGPPALARAPSARR